MTPKRAIAMATCVALAFVACTTEGPSGPTTSDPVPVVAATPVPAPTATPTPKPVEGEPAAGGAELTCLPDSTLRLDYDGEASRAYYESYWTPFDAPKTPHDILPHTVEKGGNFTRKFQACVQGDVDQPGVKEVGGCWWDVNGAPFNPSRSPEKVKACYDRCIPDVSWIEDETRSIGEWEDAPPSIDALETTTVEEKCFKTQRRLVIVFEINRCTKARRELRRFYETRQVEIECPCVEHGIPGVKDYSAPVWSGKIETGACTYGPPQLTPAASEFSESTTTVCHENGTQAWREDYTCKADVTGSINVCRTATCPQQPTCENTPTHFEGNHNNGLFNLSNSSESSEEAKVNQIVGPGQYESFDVDSSFFFDECTTAQHNAKVVIVKAGSEQSVTWEYRTYLNVVAGQQLCSYNSQKDISHVRYFRCD